MAAKKNNRWSLPSRVAPLLRSAAFHIEKWLAKKKPRHVKPTKSDLNEKNKQTLGIILWCPESRQPRVVFWRILRIFRWNGCEWLGRILRGVEAKENERGNPQSDNSNTGIADDGLIFICFLGIVSRHIQVEVKPYVLDDQFCDECQGTRSAGRFAPFFCANVTCLQVTWKVDSFLFVFCLFLFLHHVSDSWQSFSKMSLISEFLFIVSLRRLVLLDQVRFFLFGWFIFLLDLDDDSLRFIRVCCSFYQSGFGGFLLKKGRKQKFFWSDWTWKHSIDFSLTSFGLQYSTVKKEWISSFRLWLVLQVLIISKLTGTTYDGFVCLFVCLFLQYYCEHCWAMVHSRPGREFHKPLVKEGADRPRTVHFRWWNGERPTKKKNSFRFCFLFVCFFPVSSTSSADFVASLIFVSFCLFSSLLFCRSSPFLSRAASSSIVIFLWNVYLSVFFLSLSLSLSLSVFYVEKRGSVVSFIVDVRCPPKILSPSTGAEKITSRNCAFALWK